MTTIQQLADLLGQHGVAIQRVEEGGHSWDAQVVISDRVSVSLSGVLAGQASVAKINGSIEDNTWSLVEYRFHALSDIDLIVSDIRHALAA